MMDKSDFGQMLDSSDPLGAKQWQTLNQWRDIAPYCTPLQLLSLLADRDNDAPLWRQVSMPRAALYLPAETLSHNLHKASAPKPQPHPTREATPKSQEIPPAVEKDKTFDVLQAINSYHEESFRTAPKAVILSHFLENDGEMHPSATPYDATPIQELAKKSVQQDNSICSETLALILERQGKLSRAIEMYKKLIFVIPEKSSTFAIRIAALSAQLNSNEQTEYSQK